MRILLAAWRLLDRRQQHQLLALQTLSVLMAFSTVGGMAAVLPFFTALSEPHAIVRHPALRLVYEHLHFTSENRFVIVLGIMFAASVVISNLINLLGSLAIDRFAFRLGDALHIVLFNEYLHRDYEFHSKTNSATLTSNVIHETGRITGGVLRHGLLLVTNLIAVVVIVGSVVLVNPIAAVIAIVGLGASYAAVYAFARGRLLENGQTESEDVAEQTRIVSECFGAIKELLALQVQSLFVNRFARCRHSISKTVVSTFAIAQSPKYLLECSTACVMIGVALYSHGRNGATGPWIAQLTFIGLAIYRLLPALHQVFVAIVRIRTDSPAFNSIGIDLHLARARKPVVAATRKDRSWFDKPHREIHLRGVTFRHSTNCAPAIANCNLLIPAGTIVGFTGVNGSGKTTLVDVLSGLLAPQSGQIEIDGIALDATNRSAWLSSIVYVPQFIFLCDSTLAENIALGVRYAQIDPERVRTVAVLARLEQCIADLPNGFQEILGERGARLSGGQRQRLGIARALYRDASVLIMDEATSSLDADAERDVTDMIAASRQGRTTILVAHRLSALRHCAVIYELANGQIIHSGTYPQMLAKISKHGARIEEAIYGKAGLPVAREREFKQDFDEARRIAADPQ